MIIFTKHARQRMRERNITRGGVLKILKSPDIVEQQGRSVSVYIGSEKKRRVKIIMEHRRNRQIIITVYAI